MSASVYAEANVNRTKYCIDIRGFKDNFYTDVGWVSGFTVDQYFGSSDVFWGLGAYYGTPKGNALTDEYLTYGGVHIGYDYSINRHFLLQADILVGYGQGEMRDLGISEKSYYIAEPGLSAGFRLGGGWRILFTTHYLQMSAAKDFSGFSAGFRFEFKSQSANKALND